jgi:hypothetical protein
MSTMSSGTRFLVDLSDLDLDEVRARGDAGSPPLEALSPAAVQLAGTVDGGRSCGGGSSCTPTCCDCQVNCFCH